MTGSGARDDRGGATGATRRGLRWHLRENWANSWTLGRLEFEIEWVPKARCYTFCLSINTPQKTLERLDREAGYGR